MKKLPKLSDQLRRAIDEAPISRAEICRGIGMLESTMSRFMHGQKGLSQDVIDALGEFLQLEIISHKKG
jgi:transcriptional regulator with XRE-family HTH domain